MTSPAFISVTLFPVRVPSHQSPTSTTTRRNYQTRTFPTHPRACTSTEDVLQTCVRCGETFQQSNNKPGSCRYHGDVLGNVLNLNWYEDHHYDDPALNFVKGPRFGRRWACCQDTDPGAPPCKSGVHVTYDCPPARWREGIKFEVF